MQRTPAAQVLALAAALALLTAAQAQMAGMPGMNMAAAAPAPAAGASDSSCVQNPTTRNCTDYEYPESSIKADMAELCEEMPYMVGCSIQHECEVRGCALLVSRRTLVPYYRVTVSAKQTLLARRVRTPARQPYPGNCVAGCSAIQLIAGQSACCLHAPSQACGVC